MAASALLQHYLEYISSPAIILTVFVLIGPLVFSLAAERHLAPRRRLDDEVPGCRRLGLHTRSNLDNQFRPWNVTNKSKPTVAALFSYPVKSCRGVELAASEVESTGLKYDRLFTFAQLVSKPSKAGVDGESVEESEAGSSHQWRFIDQRQLPRLALLSTQLWLPDPRARSGSARTARAGRANGHASKHENPSPTQPRVRSRTRGSTLIGQLEQGSADKKGAPPSALGDWVSNGGCVVIHFPFEPDFNPFGLRTETVTIRVPLAPTPQHSEAKLYRQEELSIWDDLPQAINVTNEIDPEALKKLKYFLGVSNPLALFKVDEKRRRPLSQCLPQHRSDGSYHLGFADAFPVTLLGMNSVQNLDRALPDKAAMKGKLDARRFRANIYTSGTLAYSEDEWKRVAIGRRIARTPEGLVEVDAEYHVACRCTRSKLSSVDQDTGRRDGDEPYATMVRVRSTEEGPPPQPWLGTHMIPLFERGIIKVGDEIR